jgi:hypothetical protein
MAPRVPVSPFVDQQYKRMLGDQFDDRTRREREAADVDGVDPNSVFSRMQSDAANGPQGFNRQWIPFFEALRGDKVNMGSLGLPTHTETTGEPSEAMRSLQARNPTDVRLDELRAQSSLRERPDLPVPAAPVKAPYASPRPNYYASLASLKRGR